MRPVLRWCALLGAVFLLLSIVGWLPACGFGSGAITLSIRTPLQDALLKGLQTIEIASPQAAEIQEILIGVRRMSEDKAFKVLTRSRPSRFPFQYEWDTLLEKDGRVQLEVEAILANRVAAAVTRSPLWIVNRQARLAFEGCEQPPLLVRDKFAFTIVWDEPPPDIHITAVEIFVQGKTAAVVTAYPYKGEIDLSAWPDRSDISISAITTSGAYRGSTAICSVQVDRQGPKIAFLAPERDGVIIPRNVSVLLQVEEDFGIGEIQIFANDTLVGKKIGPPFQIPISLGMFQHKEEITLKALASDVVGNPTEVPPLRKVIVDATAPLIRILSPKAGSAEVGTMVFEASISDSEGVGLVNFYVEDSQGQRLDNLLRRTGTSLSSLFRVEVDSVIALYGAGERKFVVEALDIHQNRSLDSVAFTIGCRDEKDCPAKTPPFRCLGNRCLIPNKLGDRCDYPFSCEAPLLCVFSGLSFCSAEKLGICRKPCSKGDACSQGHFCRSTPDGKTACFPGDPCSPFTVNCTPDRQCVPWGVNSFVCLPTGNLTEGSPCLPYSCSASQGCPKNFACTPNGNSGSCRRICSTETFGGARACPPQYPIGCVAFPLADGSRNTIGTCR